MNVASMIGERDVPEASQHNLTVHVAGASGLDVREFEIEEAMSSIFKITLVVQTPETNLDLGAIVGGAASFQIRGRGAVPRAWRGLVRDARQLAVEPAGLTTYQLVIVADVWLLTERHNHRIFQHISEIDIVTTILGEWGIAHERRLNANYRPREYKVQYAESDFAFLSRMLEDAGISFFFEDANDATIMVLSDSPESADPRPTLAFRDNPTTADREHVTKVVLGRGVTPGRYTVRDHDTRLPATYPLHGGARPSVGALGDRLERFEYAPGAFLFGGADGGDSPTADDRGTVRSHEGEAKILAERRLDAIRGAGHAASFDVAANDVGPGVVVRIADHPHTDLDDSKTLLVTRSIYSGTSHGAWHHRCDARFTAVPYRPALTTPRPRISGVECATVVGAAGDEIHTDEFGRIRVAFHWDRESAMDEKSSCWIHVSQPWSGTGYGGTNLPRVGQEVLVDFLGGNPDRPIVTGRVFTTQQRTPYDLPANKTQSGWKSCSTQNTGGYNELMFEDAAGRELVRMQAEKDLQKLVKHDEDVIVGRNRTKLVKKDDALTVNNDRSKNVDRDETVVIGRDRTKLVKKDDDLTVGSNKSKLVQKNEREVVAISRTRMVGLNEAVTVGVAQTVAIGNTHNLMVGKTQNVKVGKTQSVNVGKTQSVSVGKSQKVKVGKTATETVGMVKAVTVGVAYQLSVGAAMNTTVGISQSEQVGKKRSIQVGEALDISVGKTETVTVGDKYELVVGKAKLVLEKAGKITLATGDGATIVLNGKDIIISSGAKGVVVVQGGPEVHINP